MRCEIESTPRIPKTGEARTRTKDLVLEGPRHLRSKGNLCPKSQKTCIAACDSRSAFAVVCISSRGLFAMEFLVIHHAARWGWGLVQRRRCWFLSADFGEYANKVVEDRIGLMPREKCGRFCTVYSRYVFAQKLCRTIQTFPRASIRSEDAFLRLSPEPAESETSTLSTQYVCLS